jgi:hypothetical protein
VEPKRPLYGGAIEAAVSLANRILQGEEEPYAGARQLGEMSSTLSALEQDLRGFIYLAGEMEGSRWDDSPEYRQQLERDILVKADRFRARWGP